MSKKNRNILSVKCRNTEFSQAYTFFLLKNLDNVSFVFTNKYWPSLVYKISIFAESASDFTATFMSRAVHKSNNSLEIYVRVLSIHLSKNYLGTYNT